MSRYLIRVSGDKVWSFATEESAGYDLAHGLRLVNDYRFDNATAPTSATIYPVHTAFGDFGAQLSKQAWLLTFSMTKLLGYPGSVVWYRRSYSFGFEIASKRYKIVQVVVEDGQVPEEFQCR